MDVKSRIDSFFIFNSSFGPIEGEEHKKNLYYYPSNVSQDARKIQIGLCEAVVKFMSTFSSEPCEALQTQTKRHIFYQPEKGFWMVLVAQIPYTTKALSSIGESTEEMVDPSVMKNFLKLAYNQYKMFHGPFSNTSPEELYGKCEQFFTPHMSSTHLSNDVTNIIQGISYLPLDRNTFLNVLCFIDMVQVSYPEFKCISFLYNNQLIWNALATDDMLTLYQYLVQILLPEQVKKEIQGGAVTAAQRHGRFIQPDGMRNEQDLLKVPKVNLRQDSEENVGEYYLLVYRTLSATLCFIVDVQTQLKLETLKSLDAFMGPRLSSIASTMSEQCNQHALMSAQSLTPDTKFVYFNRLNLAYKTNPQANKLVPTVKPEVLSILAGMHLDKESMGNYGEIIIKTPDEHWITGKTSNEREFYVVIQQKNMNLKEIADDVKRICDTQMKGIFFYPT